jgi:hypothetical protein
VTTASWARARRARGTLGRGDSDFTSSIRTARGQKATGQRPALEMNARRPLLSAVVRRCPLTADQHGPRVRFVESHTPGRSNPQRSWNGSAGRTRQDPRSLATDYCLQSQIGRSATRGSCIIDKQGTPSAKAWAGALACRSNYSCGTGALVTNTGQNKPRVIDIMTPSVSEGQRIRVNLLGPRPREVTTVSVIASMVTPLHTSWAFSAGAEVEQQGEEENLSFVAPSGLDSGLYMLTRLEFQSSGTTEALDTSDADQRLFELRPFESKPHSAHELLAAYMKILENRREEIRRGLGSGPHTFTAVVFVKNCLVTIPISLGPYSIRPRRGLSAKDELEAVQGFIVERGGQALTLNEDWDRTARIGQPCAVVDFPVLRAQSRDEALVTALREADLLLALLSLHRGGYGSIFSALIQDHSSGEVRLWFQHEQYSGNLMGGFVAGEEPDYIFRQMSSLRASPTSQLYVALLREAMRERDPEFKCFRLWSILETTARSKGYTGQVKRDWSGMVVKDERGRDRRIRGAEDQVFELLRQTLPSKGLHERTFASDKEQGMLSQQISLWYRRRNCLAHGDTGCLCRNPDQSPNDKFINCRRARDEMLKAGHDMYLPSLQSVVVAIVDAELDK